MDNSIYDAIAQSAAKSKDKLSRAFMESAILAWKAIFEAVADGSLPDVSVSPRQTSTPTERKWKNMMAHGDSVMDVLNSKPVPTHDGRDDASMKRDASSITPEVAVLNIAKQAGAKAGQNTKGFPTITKGNIILTFNTDGKWYSFWDTASRTRVASGRFRDGADLFSQAQSIAKSLAKLQTPPPAQKTFGDVQVKATPANKEMTFDDVQVKATPASAANKEIQMDEVRVKA